MAQTFPFIILGFYGGIKADQWNKKRILVLSDFLKVPLILMIPYLFLHGQLNFLVLVILTVLITSFKCFSEPAFRSILPEVQIKQLREANALLDSIQRGASIVVPLSLAIILKLFTEIHLFTFSAILYGITALIHLFLKETGKTIMKDEKPKTSDLQEFKDTIQYLKHKKHILFPIIGSAIAILINTGLWRVALPILLKEDFNANITVYGVVVGILGGVSFISSVVIGMLKSYQPFIMFYAGICMWGIGLITIGLSQSSIVSIYAAIILIGIGQSAQGLTRILIIQEKVPPEKLGKVFSTSSTMNYMSDTCSLSIISPIMGLMSVASIFFTGGLSLFILAIGGLYYFGRGNKKDFQNIEVSNL